MPTHVAIRLRSAGSHQRSIFHPLGNKGYAFVDIGNRLASRVALMIYYALSLHQRFLLEQPAHSAIDIHPRISELFQSCPIWRAAMWGGAYALHSLQETTASPKRHWLWSNDRSLLKRLEAAAGHLTGQELEALSQGPGLVKKQRTADGGVVFTGEKDALKASQKL